MTVTWSVPQPENISLVSAFDVSQPIYDIIASIPDDCNAEKVYELLSKTPVTT